MTDDYVIALQRAIEYHVSGDAVPREIAEKCPYHAQLLNKARTSALNPKEPKPEGHDPKGE